MNGMAKIMVAGVAGSLAFTAAGLYVGPLMGLPPGNPAAMLAAQMGGMAAVGWAGHLMIGVVLTVAYAKFAKGMLPGPLPVRGMVFSMAPWMMAMLMVMPMMGAPLFGGSAGMALSSLLGHVVFGAVIGVIVGDDSKAPA